MITPVPLSDFTSDFHFLGVNLTVFYPDSSQIFGTAMLRVGSDTAYKYLPGGHPGGPNGEIHCHEMAPSSVERPFAFTVGGSEVERYRGHRLWWRTGPGPIPPEFATDNSGSGNVVGHPEAFSVDMPYASNHVREIGIYSTEVPIPPGHSWICIQSESEEIIPVADCPTEYPRCCCSMRDDPVVICRAASLPIQFWIYRAPGRVSRPVLVR